MKKIACTAALFALAGVTSVASAQAITGFTGGSQFDVFYGGSTGDVVGFRFSVNQDIIVTDLGVWNDLNNPFSTSGIDSSHQIGIWDSGQTLLTSNAVDGSGTVVDDWTYMPTSNVTLVTGQTYTIGALYWAGDNDTYVSSASNVTSHADVNWLNSVFPSGGDLGFAFPTEDSSSSSGGRFGPNFLFVPVPAPSTMALLGLGGFVATRRRR